MHTIDTALTLSGLRVVEMAAIGPVPFAATMLADMGAEVTRVDRIPDGKSSEGPWPFMNRGRQSVAVNLKDQRGVEAVLSMLERADIVIEGFRPGVMERIGLGPEVCLGRNPRLIYGRMTGWGQEGPLSARAGHDINYIAITGALHATGWPDRPPTPPLALVGDFGGGAMMLLTGILAAVIERGRSGRGQVIDAAMTDGAALLMAPIYAARAAHQWSDDRGANAVDGGAHFYGAYECADSKYVSIGPIEPQFYKLLLSKLDIQDPDFAAQFDPGKWPTLRARLETLFKTRSRAQWCQILEGTDACFAPVLTLAEAPEHPHNRSRGTFVEINGAYQPAPAPRFSRTPSRASAQLPGIGENTMEVLRDSGIGQEKVMQLIADGAVYGS